MFSLQNGFVLKEVDSTNSYLKQIVRNVKLPNGYFVRAEYQTSGRGQMSNSWTARRGENLLLSVLYRPQGFKVEDQFFISMSVCLAIVDTLKAYGLTSEVKWPNDILVDSRKIAGILVENSLSSKLDYAIIGIGLNVNQYLELEGNATSLVNHLKSETNIHDLFVNLYRELEKRLELIKSNRTSLKREYLNNLFGYQKSIKILLDGVEIEGVLMDVQEDGRIKLLIDKREHLFSFKQFQFIL